MTSSLATRITAIDFQNYIEQLTSNFTGRKWVFDRINDWLKNQKDRFFLLTGKPGVGKSAIAAQFTKQDIVKAYHFCRAGDVETIIPNRIFRSLAAQLGEKLPFYAEALVNTIKPVHLSVEANIKIENMIGGQVTGVIINNLTTTNPEEELEILIRAPLAELPKIYADKQKNIPDLAVILIDSLDEAVTTSADVNLVKLLASLSHSENFPSWVRFVLTSRRESQVLREFKPLEPYELDDNSSDSRRDIEEYIQSRVQQEKLNQVLQNANVKPQRLIDKISNLSSGNFLYTKLLLNDIEAERQSLDNLSALPKSINEIYHNFLKRLVDEWQHHYQPILGTLTVTQEPITEEQLANFTGIQPRQLRQDLGVVRQFLAVVKDEKGKENFAIFHQSLRDYLLDKERNQDFWCDAKEQHDLIANYYKKDSASWENVEWVNADKYGLLHLPKHLDAAGREEELYALLTGSPNWMEAKFNAFSSDAAYVDDLELAIKKFSDPLKPNELLTLTKLYTARQVVHQRSNSYKDADLITLVWFGREQEALSYARLRPDADEKFRGLLTIHNTLQEKGQLNLGVLDEVREVADAIENNSARVAAQRNVAIALVRAKQFAESQEIVGKIETSDRAEVMRELAAAFAKNGLFKEASQAFDRAEEFARQIEDTLEQLEALRKLAIALAGAGNANKAREIFAEARQFIEQMEYISDKAEALSELAAAQMQAEFIDEAKTDFCEAKKFAEEINHNLTQAEALRKWAVAQALAGFPHEANQAFTKVKELVPPIKEESSEENLIRAEALRYLALALVQVKDVEKGLAIFTEAMDSGGIEAGWHQAEVLREFGVALIQAGFINEGRAVFTEVEQVVRTIEENWKQVEVLRNLAKSLAQAGFIEQASSVFREIRKSPSAIEEDSQREETLSKWAAALKQAEFAEEAMAICTDVEKVERATVEIEEIWQQAKKARDVEAAFQNRDTLTPNSRWEEAEALRQLAVDLAEVTEFTKIKDVVTKTINSYPIPYKEMGALAIALALAGCITEAEKVARAIEDYFERAGALKELTIILAHIERFTEAFRTLGLIEIPSQFLDDLLEWTPALEGFEKGLSVNILQETIRIFGWIYADWHQIYTNFDFEIKDITLPDQEAESLTSSIQNAVTILYRHTPKNKLISLKNFEKKVQQQIHQIVNLKIEDFRQSLN